MRVHTAYPEGSLFHRILAVQSRDGPPDSGDFVYAGDRLECQDVDPRPVARGRREGCETAEVEGFKGCRCETWINTRVLEVEIKEIQKSGNARHTSDPSVSATPYGPRLSALRIFFSDSIAPSCS